MCTRHLEALTFIRRDKDFSFPFVSFSFFGYMCILYTIAFEYIAALAAHLYKLSYSPLSEDSFYGIRIEYFIRTFLFNFFFS